MAWQLAASTRTSDRLQQTVAREHLAKIAQLIKTNKKNTNLNTELSSLELI